MTTDKECFIDYNKFYTKQEVDYILESKGLNKGDFVLCRFVRALKIYNMELFNNTIIKVNRPKNLILKEFVDNADWEFFKELKDRKSKSLYPEFIRNHFKDSADFDKFYTRQQFNQILKSKGLNKDEINLTFFRHAMESYNTELSDSIFSKNNQNKIVILKEFVDSLDWEFIKLLKNLKVKRHLKLIIENHFEGYISAYTAAIIIGINPRKSSSLENAMEEENDMFTTIKKNGVKMVKTKDVIRWREFKSSFITIGEIFKSVVDEIGQDNKDRSDFYINKKRNMMKSDLFDKYNPISQNDTPFRTKNPNELYIDIKYQSEVYYEIKYRLLHDTIQAFGSAKDKFNYRLNQIVPQKNKVTLNEFSKFAISRISELVGAHSSLYISILDKLEFLDKEIMLLSTEEVSEIIESLPTKEAKEEFTKFLNKLRSQRPTKYSQIEYNIEHNKKMSNYHLPYTEEQYQRFGFLVLSDSHIWYDDYIEKALAKRCYASTWLYSILHYISAWRCGDLINNFPHPDLRMDANAFLNKVKSKTLAKEEALDIIEQVNMRLNLWNLRPSKTKSNTTPNLVMEIPESIYEFVGTLIGICEAHYQLSHHPGKRGLISKQAMSRKTQVEFYGPEFIEIFGECGFNNLRAVKNYEIIMSRKADEKKLGTGYMLASIARAHKFKLDKKAETTMVYLKYYKNMEDAEAIVTELFERGVCSFVPYMLTKIVSGKENILSLTHAERTKEIKEIVGMSAFESEMLIQGYNLALERAKSEINEIIQLSVRKGLDPKEIAKDILLNIIYNEAPSKQGNIPCMLIAQGKSCIYPKRENCVGCGHEIYLKSCLFELGNRIQQAKEQALASKTQASKNKNILMIKNVLSPIVAEIFITLKDVYKIENIDDLKKLIR